MNALVERLRRRLPRTPANCRWEIHWRSGYVRCRNLRVPTTRASATIVAHWVDQQTQWDGNAVRLTGRRRCIAWTVSPDARTVRLLHMGGDPLRVKQFARRYFGYEQEPAATETRLPHRRAAAA